MTTATPEVDVRDLSEAEAHELFDRQAQESLGMTGSDFIRAWEAGAFDDDPERPEVMRLVMLLPFGR
jgi:hypothetical protein